MTDVCVHRVPRIARSTKLPPLIVVETTDDSESILSVPRYEILNDADVPQASPTAAAKILSTKWHEYSDDGMRNAVSQLTTGHTEGASTDDPCYTIMRVLSSAVTNLTRVRAELEASRRALQEKEAARRERAQQLLQELQPSEKDVANRVLQSLFPDDDESVHRVHRMERQQSLMVSSWSLSSVPVLDRRRMVGIKRGLWYWASR